MVLESNTIGLNQNSPTDDELVVEDLSWLKGMIGLMWLDVSHQSEEHKSAC